MPIFLQRGFNQTKDTQQLTFEAGEDLGYQQYVKRQAPNSSIVVDAVVQSDAIGYVLNRRGAKTGDVVSVQMVSDLEFDQGGGTGSVTQIIDNSDGTFTADPNNGQPSVTWASGGLVLTNKIAYIDPVNGNNATALVSRLDRPFETFAGAWAVADADTTIFFWTGNHTITTSYQVTNTNARRFYFMNGANITTQDDWLQVNAGIQVVFRGAGNFFLDDRLLDNNQPSTGLVTFDIEGQNFQMGASNTIMNLTSCIGKFKARNLIEATFFNEGFCQVEIDANQWRNADVDYFSVDSFIEQNGAVYVGANGTPYIKSNAHYLAPTGSSQNALIRNTTTNTESKDPQIFINGTCDLRNCTGYSSNKFTLNFDVKGKTSNALFFDDASGGNCDMNFKGSLICESGDIGRFDCQGTKKISGRLIGKDNSKMLTISNTSEGNFKMYFEYLTASNLSNQEVLEYVFIENEAHQTDVYFDNVTFTSDGQSVITISDGVLTNIKVLSTFSCNTSLPKTLYQTVVGGKIITSSNISPLEVF